MLSIAPEHLCTFFFVIVHPSLFFFLSLALSLSLFLSFSLSLSLFLSFSLTLSLTLSLFLSPTLCRVMRESSSLTSLRIAGSFDLEKSFDQICYTPSNLLYCIEKTLYVIRSREQLRKTFAPFQNVENLMVSGILTSPKMILCLGDPERIVQKHQREISPIQ